MRQFKKESKIHASAEKVFAFHEAPDAFERLMPPWQTAEIVQPPASLQVGTRVIVRVKLGPIWRRIVAEHVEYEPGRLFADQMVEGPFAYWLHRHVVTPDGPESCTLTDDIRYSLPLGAVGGFLGGWLADRQLHRMFEHRHEVTRRACEA